LPIGDEDAVMWGRLFHQWRAHRYARLAERSQRDLTEYVLAEESRITRLLHRAGWHFTQAQRSGKSFGERPMLHHTAPRAVLKDGDRLSGAKDDGGDF
jgi:hypothetical protein